MAAAAGLRAPGTVKPPVAASRGQSPMGPGKTRTNNSSRAAGDGWVSIRGRRWSSGAHKRQAMCWMAVAAMAPMTTRVDAGCEGLCCLRWCSHACVVAPCLMGSAARQGSVFHHNSGLTQHLPPELHHCYCAISSCWASQAALLSWITKQHAVTRTAQGLKDRHVCTPCPASPPSPCPVLLMTSIPPPTCSLT